MLLGLESPLNQGHTANSHECGVPTAFHAIYVMTLVIGRSGLKSCTPPYHPESSIHAIFKSFPDLRASNLILGTLVPSSDPLHYAV